MAPGSLLAARLRQYWEWLLGIHRGCTELSGGYVVRRPLGVLHGDAGTACRPQGRRRSEDVCVEGYDSEVVRWTVCRAPGDGAAAWEEHSRGARGVQGDGVLASWGYTRRYWGPYGGGTRRYWGTVQWGSSGDAWQYWGVPLTPLTTQGARRGIPWAR